MGFAINRFSGDLAPLKSGLDWLERETDKPVLGVLPHRHGLDLEAEDAVPISPQDHRSDGRLRVLVPLLPRISNHTEFNALRRHPGVDFRFVRLGPEPPRTDLVILPGTKSVRSDLAALREAAIGRLADAVEAHLDTGRLLYILGDSL